MLKLSQLWGTCHWSWLSGTVTKAAIEQHEPEAGRVAGKNQKEGKQSVRMSETSSSLIMCVSVTRCLKKKFLLVGKNTSEKNEAALATCRKSFSDTTLLV